MVVAQTNCGGIAETVFDPVWCMGTFPENRGTRAQLSG
jgi:hypothetical protein